MFDQKITALRHQYGINEIADWATVKPEWVLQPKGNGKALLDHLRLYLAAKGVTLKDDMTPKYWMDNADTRIAKTLSYDDCTVVVPFTILIDSMEQQPWSFDGIAADVTETPNDINQMIKIGEIDRADVKLKVPTKVQAIGVAMGDYSIAGHKGHCNIERKSMNDAHSTILGWGDHRRRFEVELENLAALDCAAVVVECSLGQLLADAPSRGKKTASENRKILHRQVLSWQQQYRVPWIFCDSRRLAEITAFRILQRYFKKFVQSAGEQYVMDETTQDQLADL